MKCTDCNGMGMKCDDTLCSFNKERTKIHINCTHCNKAKPCPECEALGGFELVTIAECYPDTCISPGADKGSIAGCYTCKQVKLRPLTENEELAFRRLANQIGCDTDEWIIDKVNKHEAKLYGRPMRLRPKKYEVKNDKT